MSELHWIGRARARPDQRLLVRLRHGPDLTPARFVTGPAGIEIQLAEPDPGVAPGQFVVFYDKTRCLGSARIAVPLADADSAAGERSLRCSDRA